MVWCRPPPQRLSNCRYKLAILNDCKIHTFYGGWLVAPKTETAHFPEVPVERPRVRPAWFDEQKDIVTHYKVRDPHLQADRGRPAYSDDDLSVFTYMFDGEVRQTCSFCRMCDDRPDCLIDCTLVLELTIKGREAIEVVVVRMVETEAVSRGGF